MTRVREGGGIVLVAPIAAVTEDVLLLHPPCRLARRLLRESLSRNVS